MKITLLQENLKNSLNTIERVIGKNLTLPALNNTLLETEKNFLKLSSTDLEIGINYWILGKTEKEGNISIPAKFLSSFIGALPNKQILLETKEKTLNIECEKFSAQIKGFSAEDFPIIPKIKSEEFIEVDSLEFAESLGQVASIPVPSSARPEISGVFVVFAKNQIKIVSTDSFRLAEKLLPLESKLEKAGSPKERSLILLQKTAQELIYTLQDRKGKLRIYFSPNQVMFELLMEETSHPLFQIISRLIDGDYPNYQEIIPAGHKTQVVLPKEEFLNQVKVASLFSGKVSEVKFKADPQKDNLEIYSQNQEIGENKSQVFGKIKGDKTEVSFNWRFIQEGIMNIRSSEIILELNGENGPGVLKPVGASDYIYIVMPIKAS